MPLFPKSKMSALSAATPPPGFGRSQRATGQQLKKKQKDTSKPITSGFLASFGKK